MKQIYNKLSWLIQSSITIRNKVYQSNWMYIFFSMRNLKTSDDILSILFIIIIGRISSNHFKSLGTCNFTSLLIIKHTKRYVFNWQTTLSTKVPHQKNNIDWILSLSNGFHQTRSHFNFFEFGHQKLEPTSFISQNQIRSKYKKRTPSMVCSDSEVLFEEHQIFPTVTSFAITTRYILNGFYNAESQSVWFLSLSSKLGMWL